MVFYIKFERRRLHGYQIYTGIQSDRLVCVLLMNFVMARKVQRYALELDDIVTGNLLNLSSDSADLKFATLYEILIQFLRNTKQ